jgi:hypothetical protein
LVLHTVHWVKDEQFKQLDKLQRTHVWVDKLGK